MKYTYRDFVDGIINVKYTYENFADGISSCKTIKEINYFAALIANMNKKILSHEQVMKLFEHCHEVVSGWGDNEGE